MAKSCLSLHLSKRGYSSALPSQRFPEISWVPPPILWCCRQDNEEDTKDKGRETFLLLFFFYCFKNMWVSSTDHGIICPTSKEIRFLFQSKDPKSSTGGMLFSLLAVLHPYFLWGTLEFHNGRGSIQDIVQTFQWLDEAILSFEGRKPSQLNDNSRQLYLGIFYTFPIDFNGQI